MKKLFILSTACVAFAIFTFQRPAHAQEVGTLHYYAIPEAEKRAHYYEWSLFLEYNLHREPCQHYREPPAGYVLKDCEVYAAEGPLAAIQPRAGESSTSTTTLVPPDSTIYFDFDKSNITEGQKEKLDTVIRDITQRNPGRVTVSGHADRAGSEEYNQELSLRRAKSVTKEMTEQGIKQEIIEEEAFGETQPAVPTDDGVALQENRRAIIQYNE